MKTFLLLLIAPFFIGGIAHSQSCNVSISTLPSQVCPGSTINLNATGFVTGANYSFNFNVGTLPTGWSTTGGTSFNSNLCGPSLDASNYFWASTSTSTPQIVTADFDICSGGTLKFDMKYAIQGQASPCEGPDEEDEGVSIEYKIGAGPWVEFIYYRPDGTILPNCPAGNTIVANGITPFTSWNTFTVPIPAAAISTNTKFRWIQKNSSGGPFDNWGLDNVYINAGPCVSGNIDWSNGTQNSSNTNIVVNTDTCITAYLYDVNNVLLCQSTPVCFTVFTPNIDAGDDRLICPGELITLTASGGTGFVWDHGVINGVPFTTSTPQTYHVTGTDLNGCFATDSLMVSINPLLPTGISYPETAYCNSATNPAPTVSGSTSGIFTLTPATMSINATTGVLNLATSTASPLETYTITYTPTDICLIPSSCEIKVYAQPLATISSTVAVCQNATNPNITITGSNATAPYTFDYNINGGTTQTVSSVGNTYSIAAPTANVGTYIYTLTNVSESGPKVCARILNETITVTIKALPVITNTDNQTICIGGSVILNAGGASSYIWDNGVQNGVAFSPTTTNNYTVTATGANGCTNTASATVIVNPLTPTSIAYADTAYCNSASNPTPTISGSLAGAFTISPTTMNINASTGVLHLASSTVSPFQTYTVTYTPTDLCLMPATFQVKVYSLPEAHISSTIAVCQNDANPTINITGSNATAPYSFNYNINGGTTQTGTSVGNIFSISAPTTNVGTFVYTLTNVTESGPRACSKAISEAITVTIKPLPVITNLVAQAICYGDSAILHVGGASSYSWSAGVQNGVPFYPSSTNTYTVTATGSNNCVSTGNVIVTVNALPNINAGIDQKACLGQEITLSGSAGISYVWTGGITNNTGFYPPLGSNNYYVIGTDANGCKNMDSVIVQVLEPVIAGIDADPITGFPGLTVNFVNNSLYGNTYDWNFGNGITSSTVTLVGQSSFYGNPGTYNAIITAYNGYCEDTAMIKIIISSYPDPTIKVPNVFTPNEDQSNDVWWINVDFGKSIYVQIFNRWGNLMTEMNNFTDRWDGKSQDGKEATDGVYFYKYVIVDLNDKTHEGHGHITIER